MFTLTPWIWIMPKRWRKLAVFSLAAFSGCQDALDQGGVPSRNDSIQTAAERGDAFAQYSLGVMYANGEGVPEDDVEAIRWFQAAAEQGDASAQYSLGFMYATGKGVSGDNTSEAISWFRVAASQGDALAQSILDVVNALCDPGTSWILEMRIRVGLYTCLSLPEPHIREQVRAAAEQGDAFAQSAVGVMHTYGWGVPESSVEASRWYRAAAEQGDAFAQYSFGVMYATGEGMPENDVEAVRWFRVAAEQGYISAQYRLGLMYDNSWGVPEDDVEAFPWFRAAAEHGYAPAQYRLSRMYANGWGVLGDDVYAYAWANLAAAQGYESARDLKDHLSSRMSPSQISRAQKVSLELLGYIDFR